MKLKIVLLTVYKPNGTTVQYVMSEREANRRITNTSIMAEVMDIPLPRYTVADAVMM